MSEQALSDVKVVDLTHFISGPYCTRLLADYGAEVVKVERPGVGDGARKLGPFLKDEPHPEKSGLFMWLNTNKQGITLNLKSETGKEILLRLIEDADILVENFRPRVMSGLGLGYEVLKEINPQLVMVSISSFGQTGPYRDFKASELVLNGMGSEMYSHGISTREPLKLGGNAIQMQAGIVAASAVAIALWGAENSGHGDHLDISIYETQIGSPDRRAVGILGYQYGGKVAKRMAPGVTVGYPSGAYMCMDGYIQLAGGVQFWDRIMKMLDYPEELSSPAFGSPEGQTDPDLKGFFDAYFIPWCLEKTKQEVFLKGQAANVLCGPVNTMEDVLADEHFRVREFFTEVEHPVMGKVTIPGAPFNPQETPWRITRPAPLLGQHNAEVLGNLGYTGEDLVRLKEADVI